MKCRKDGLRLHLDKKVCNTCLMDMDEVSRANLNLKGSGHMDIKMDMVLKLLMEGLQR